MGKFGSNQFAFFTIKYSIIGLCPEDDGPLESCCGGPCGSKEDTGKIRDVKINQVNYGYIVKIGCHPFVFETAERLIEKLGVYLKEPNKTERNWYNGSLL